MCLLVLSLLFLAFPFYAILTVPSCWPYGHSTQQHHFRYMLLCLTISCVSCLLRTADTHCLPGHEPYCIVGTWPLSSSFKPSWRANRMHAAWLASLSKSTRILTRCILGHPVCFSSMTSTTWRHLSGENPTLNGRVIMVEWSCDNTGHVAAAL